jgi:tripartite-type tricarboxylate transporter receptor subunit TctC
MSVKLSRRELLHFATAAAALQMASRVSFAQAFPSRSLRWIVGAAAGSSPDIIARLLSQSLSEKLGQQLVIDNRPGGGTNIATQAVVNAPPDGYTLLFASTAGAINATLYDKLNFNFMRDVAPVAGIVRLPLVMVVSPSISAKTVPEFIAYANANSDKINVASAGNGTPQHVAGELFKMMTGVRMLHVPFRSEAPALTELIADRVQVMFATMPAAVEHIRAGTLRPLAVTTAQRSDALPNMPMVGSYVAGYEASAWYGVGAPKGTPKEIIDKLNIEINASLADTKMRARLAELGGAILHGSPADFGKLIADETAKWSKVVKFSGAKPD